MNQLKEKLFKLNTKKKITTRFILSRNSKHVIKHGGNHDCGV